MVHVSILATLIYGVTIYRHYPWKLKRFTLGFNFMITSAIRCLSAFSGWILLKSFSFSIWNLNSIGKAFWLWPIVELGFWSRSYLGTCVDVQLEKVSPYIILSSYMITTFQESQSTVDEHGSITWTSEY